MIRWLANSVHEGRVVHRIGRDVDGTLVAEWPGAAHLRARRDVDLAAFRDALNTVDWADLGFVCDGRHLFAQRSLENAPLPDSFRRFLPDAA